MKILSLSILSIALSVSLFARLNPFEPTDHFLEQKELIIQANEREKLQQEQEEINKKEQAIEAQNIAEQELANKKMAAEIVQENTIKIDNIKPEVVMVEETPYIPEIKENFKVLPFVKIYVVNDLLTIKVDTKYKLLNQDILTPVKKLLFDFEGNESFYTVRKDIISESFKSFAVGTHMEEGFFRIVIDLPKDIIYYIEKIDSEKGIITIMKKK